MRCRPCWSGSRRGSPRAPASTSSRRRRRSPASAGASSGARAPAKCATSSSSGEAMIKAVYPGTFDPLTRGHEDLVRRASTLFDALIVGVADSKAKRTFFTLQERVEMARESLGALKNVQVVGFSGLLIEFIRQHDARVVLRGLRAVSDFEYEF